MVDAGCGPAAESRGHDVIAVTERGDLRGRADAAIFVAAQAEARTVVTEDVSDYRVLAAAAIHGGRTHMGLIFTNNRRFPRNDLRTPDGYSQRSTGCSPAK